MSEKIKPYNIEQAQEESQVLQKKIASGEASDYENAERQVEWNKWVKHFSDLSDKLERQHKEAETFNKALKLRYEKKEITWEEYLEDRDNKEGGQLDKGVDEILIGLNAHGLHTAVSCRGHADRIKGPITRVPTGLGGYKIENIPSFPYVEFGPGTLTAQKDMPYEERKRQRNLFIEQEHDKIRKLLDSFYADKHDVSPDAKLVATYDDIMGNKHAGLTNEVGKNSFRRHRQDLENLSAEELRDIVLACQKEFDAFAQFLKNNFFRERLDTKE